MAAVPIRNEWVAWTARHRVRTQVVRIRVRLAELERQFTEVTMMVGDLAAWCEAQAATDDEPRKYVDTSVRKRAKAKR